MSRVLWVVALGALAYFLEYTDFPFEAIVKTVFYILGVVLILLLALEEHSRELSGRLPASSERDAESKRGLFRSDPVFGLVVTIYAGVYLLVLRYSDTNGPYRIIEWFLEFTPTELFWLFGPIYLFWYFRKHARAKPDAQ